MRKSTCSCRGPDSIPSTHRELHSHPSLQFQETWWPLRSSMGLWCTDIHVRTSQTLNKSKEFWVSSPNDSLSKNPFILLVMLCSVSNIPSLVYESKIQLLPKTETCQHTVSTSPSELSPPLIACIYNIVTITRYVSHTVTIIGHISLSSLDLSKTVLVPVFTLLSIHLFKGDLSPPR